MMVKGLECALLFFFFGEQNTRKTENMKIILNTRGKSKNLFTKKIEGHSLKIVAKAHYKMNMVISKIEGLDIIKGGSNINKHLISH